MSGEELQQFRNYVSCDDQQVYEPYFIAQYLLAPVNTTVKNTLLPWMMKEYKIPTTPKKGKTHTTRELGRLLKAKIYLKYELLVNLMQVVKRYGRTAYFDFEKTEN